MDAVRRRRSEAIRKAVIPILLWANGHFAFMDIGVRYRSLANL